MDKVSKIKIKIPRFRANFGESKIIYDHATISMLIPPIDVVLVGSLSSKLLKARDLIVDMIKFSVFESEITMLNKMYSLIDESIKKNARNEINFEINIRLQIE